MIEDACGAVINFNTAELTRRATLSLLEAGIPRVLVLDNASGAEDYARLRDGPEMADPRVTLIRSAENLGFAAGSNRLIAEALRDARCARVVLLNSDAVAVPAGLRACLRAMREGGHDLMGARMMKPGDGVVDSLGIAMYRSLLASNRKSVDDAYLGPTGGLAVYSRRFLEEVARLHGHVFDERYFCYAEDTDLCLRARLLGFSAGYTDEVAGYHEGQASNAGRYDAFILYHGIRNSIWMLAKSMPFAIVLAHLPWVLALHAGIVLRHTRQGSWRTLWRLYRDAFAALPAVLADRRVVQATRRVTLRELRSHIDRHFYETRFVKGALADLFDRRGGAG